MKLYEDDEIIRGTGMLEQALLQQAMIPGYSERLSRGIAIGIISAAIKSGLSAKNLASILQSSFGDDGPVIQKTAASFEGGNWSTDLWELQANDKYKLCYALRGIAKPRWHYSLSCSPDRDDS